ncbi:MAG TPA: EAL domain-containing protein [Allosphingosinicella sp.]|jgi:diguanylate cyclase (GGDEF)-like protein/PAS domain S-box-containing protein|nr:EAL domain-containing protein [Allosphingosinicella sp.]
MLRADPKAMLTGAEPGDDAEALRAALAETHAQLREARRTFEQFAANLNGVAYRCQLGAPWRMAFVSSGVEGLTGYPAEALGAATSWADIMHPDDVAAVQAEVAAAVAERRNFNPCYRIVHASGEQRWVREQGRAVYDEAGRPSYLEGVILDAGQEKRLELSLREAEADASRRADSLNTLLDAVPQMIWSYDPTKQRPRYSKQWETFTGIDLNAIGAPTRLDLVHPDDFPAAQARWSRSLATHEPYESQYRVRHHEGDYRWILSRGRPHQAPDGSVHWYGSCTDIHERMLTEAALDASERLSRGIIDASPDCISVLGLDGRRLFANAATRLAYQVADDCDLVGELWGTRFPEPARSRAAEALAKAQSGEQARLLIQYGADHNWWDIILAPVRDDHRRPIRIIVLSRDISDQKKAEERASWAANHDALTGLPNRFLFQKTLDEAIACVHLDGGGGFGILLLDVDDFKRINDTLGHDAGDALLCTFAERIRGALRTEDMVARLGGDEFAVLLSGVEEEEGVAAAVETIFAALREPCVHGGRVLDCQASIGASLFPQQGVDRAELLKNADVALYAAKAAGRANLKLFRADMRKEMQTRVSMLNLARDALAHRRIVPFYQPKIDLETGGVAGFEALLRWRHPSMGPQSPATISAAFEDMALAFEISDEMVGAVIADLVRWRGEGVEIGHVAINAAAAEFRRGDFADKLLERLHEAGLPPSLLQVEVTETVFLGRGAESVERALKLLSGAGVGIALDDFGTGYASLSHLKQFPVDLIKIDRSFVRDLEEDPDDAAIIDAVVNLGRSLGIRTVAEGVENERQHGFIASLGCDYGQGFLYGKAAPAGEVEAMLKRRESRLRLVG